MNIRRYKVQGFRSLFDVCIQPRQLTVVVGANNSGKSNLAEAFDFLGEVHRHGLEVAVARKGGFENIAHRRMRRTKRPLRFDVEVALRLRDVPVIRRELVRLRQGDSNPSALTLFPVRKQQWNPEILMHHSFELGAAGQAIGADVTVRSEHIELTVDAGGPNELAAKLWRNGDGSIEGDVSDLPPNSERDPLIRRLFGGFVDAADYDEDVLGTTELLPSLLGVFNPAVREFERRLGGLHLYQLAPLECRRAGAPTPNPDLEVHGGNLPAVVEHMQRHAPEVWEQLTNAMRKIVPGLSEIRTGFTHDRLLTLQFVEEGAGRPWTAEEISDGTIQSLALFAAVFDPRTPLAFIEEPENAVHPWIVRSFVDACRSAESKQIIVTTHSPALIDYLSPDDVLVVWKAKGRTQLARMIELDPDARRLWAEGQMSTFDIVNSGWLPQTVPEGLT